MRIAVHEESSLRHQPPRPGFTLVEVLIVVVIIGILASLTLPAISRAMERGKHAQAVQEMTSLNQSLERFKAKYGVYPPSRIRVRESTKYNLSDPFDQLSIKYLRRIWPSITIYTDPASGAAALPNGVAPFVWYAEFAAAGGDGTSTTYELEGDECLVFFLGGITQQLANSAIGPFVQHGFTARPTDPSNIPNTALPQSLQREPKLFDFDPGRLFVRTQLDAGSAAKGNLEFGNNYASYIAGAGQMVSVAPLNGDRAALRPIAYFSAYEGQGYRPHDCNIQNSNDLAISEPTTQFCYQFPAVGYLTSASFPPNPYTTTDPNPSGAAPTSGGGTAGRWDGLANQNGAVVQYLNPQSYQIVNPGLDGLFGPGGQIPRNPAQLLVNGKADLNNGGASFDNLTSISGSEKLGDFNRLQKN